MRPWSHASCIGAAIPADGNPSALVLLLNPGPRPRRRPPVRTGSQSGCAFDKGAWERFCRRPDVARTWRHSRRPGRPLPPAPACRRRSKGRCCGLGGCSAARGRSRAEPAERARRNGAIYPRRHPHHAPIRIENTDAASFPFLSGNLMIFPHNPFGGALIRRVVTNLDRALLAERRSLFVVYCNPVYGECLDASPVLERHHAGAISHAQHGQGPPIRRHLAGRLNSSGAEGGGCAHPRRAPWHPLRSG
jgi:hypothetical protein